MGRRKGSLLGNAATGAAIGGAIGLAAGEIAHQAARIDIKTPEDSGKSFKEILAPPVSTQPEQASQSPSTENDQRQVNLRLSSAAKKQLDMMAVELDTTRQALIEEAINELFRRHNKPPIA